MKLVNFHFRAIFERPLLGNEHVLDKILQTEFLRGVARKNGG